jgi:streptomycin 6-kinase
VADAIEVPAELARTHERISGDEGRAWVEGLPALAGRLLDAWGLRLDGPSRHGLVSLVLPVRRADARAAALKLQPRDHETEGEPVALRTWDGDGAVRLLAEDQSGAMLLERLDTDRSLNAVEDDIDALQPLAEIMARLVRTPAPPGLRRLADIAAAMLRRVPAALARLGDDDRATLSYWAGAVVELAGEPGDRLLHWDLHYENVLAAEREPWLAIDPKPLAGDPGFELLPALHNRWEQAVASGDVARAVRRRFDLMVDVLGLERDRARGWTMGRLLQNGLWDVAGGEPGLNPVQLAIFDALRYTVD